MLVIVSQQMFVLRELRVGSFVCDVTLQHVCIFNSLSGILSIDIDHVRCNVYYY